MFESNRPQPRMSDAFMAFMREAPTHAQSWMAMVRGLDGASALDERTEELAHLAVLDAYDASSR